jgi:hypothetical protein
MPIGFSPVEKHARVASFNNSESQDLDLSDDKEIYIQADCLEQVTIKADLEILKNKIRDDSNDNLSR